jgi:biotin-(acetyl-CoA carboxylase) ligase
MGDRPQVARGDYEYKKEEVLSKVASTLEECLKKFHGEEEARIREDIAKYMIGYLGIYFGLHVQR